MVHRSDILQRGVIRKIGFDIVEVEARLETTRKLQFFLREILTGKSLFNPHQC